MATQGANDQSDIQPLIQLLTTFSIDDLSQSTIAPLRQLVEQKSKVNPETIFLRIQTATKNYAENESLTERTKQILDNLLDAAMAYLSTYDKKPVLVAIDRALTDLYANQGILVNFTQRTIVCSKLHAELLPIKDDLTKFNPLPPAPKQIEPPPLPQDNAITVIAVTPPLPPPPPPMPSFNLAEEITTPRILKTTLAQPEPKIVTERHAPEIRSALFDKLKKVREQLEGPKTEVVAENSEQAATSQPTSEPLPFSSLHFKRNLQGTITELQRCWEKKRLAKLRSDPVADSTVELAEVNSLKRTLKPAAERKLADNPIEPRTDASAILNAQKATSAALKQRMTAIKPASTSAAVPSENPDAEEIAEEFSELFRKKGRLR